MKRMLVGSLTLAVLVSSAAYGQASGYFLDRMPTVSGASIYPVGINDNGSVAVTAYLNTGGSAADVITKGKVVTEPGMGSDNIPMYNSQQMVGINNTGGAVGVGFNAYGFSRAEYWDANGNPWELIPPDGRDSSISSTAVAINDNHVVVGYSERPDYTGYLAQIWRSGYTTDMHVLPTLGNATVGSTMPTGIGRTTEYVSATYYTDTTEYAVKYFNGNIVTALANANGNGINDHGVLVGSLCNGAAPYPCQNQIPMKDGKVLPSLGGVFSVAFGINNSDVAVGQSNGHAVKWSATGAITDLDTLMRAQAPKNVVLASASQITDGGKIFVIGSLTQGGTVYYQLTPAIPNSIKISSNINPASYGQQIHLVASIIPSQKSAPVPQGNVNWYDNGKLVYQAAGITPIGTASWEPSNLAPGKHSVTVTYAGYSPNAANTSAVFNQTINVASTKVSLGISATSITHGQSVKLTATVVPTYGTISGTVTFKSGSTVLGTASVNSKKQATLSPVFKTAGKYTVTAVYGASTDFAGSTSAGVTVTVK